MSIRGKFFAAAVVPLIAAGAVLTAGGPAHAQTPPLPIGNSITASNAISDSISDVTANVITTATGIPTGASVVGFPRLVQYATESVRFGATINTGSSLFWSPVIPSTGFTLNPFTGVLTVPDPGTLTSRVTFTVRARHFLSLSPATAVATVTVTPVSPSSELVLVTPDTVVLDAPVNSEDMIFFPTEPPGVPEAVSDAPAGSQFSDGVLSAGSAVPGLYQNVEVTATDALGAAARLTFDATVAPVFAPVPVLHHGHGVSVAPTRENVYFIQSGAPSWDHFIIVGPGPINGHEGWVWGQLGLNVAVYSGLESGHGYTVFYHPVMDQGSDVPVPGSHGAHVFFITARH